VDWYGLIFRWCYGVYLYQAIIELSELGSAVGASKYSDNQDFKLCILPLTTVQ